VQARPALTFRGLKAALALVLLTAAGVASAANLNETLKRLDTRNFRQIIAVAEEVAASGHERAPIIVEAIQQGNLYLRASDKRAFIKRKEGGEVVDALTGETVSDAGQLNELRINNLVRMKLRELVSRSRLQHPDPQKRLAAVRDLYGNLSPEQAQNVRELAVDETNERVKHAMRIAAAISSLKHGEPPQQLEAIDTLDGSLESAARNQLTSTMNNKDAAEPVREAAGEALSAIQTRVSIYNRIEQVFFGLSLGSVLVLAAIGLAITFGVMGVINMAHGEMIMLGAYTTYVVQQVMPNHMAASLVVAIPAAFLVSGSVGIGIERSVIRFLYGRPLETLLATFGVSLILQQAVRTIFGPLNKSVTTPSWMSGSIEFNPVFSLTINRLVIIGFALAVFVGLVLILKRTNLGLRVRAVSQNRSMARAVGVRSEWVDAMTFGLGSGVAGLAGVALSQITNVGPNLGQQYIVDSFLTVVFGGAGNLLGTLFAGMSLGIANKFLEPTTGTVLAKVLVLVFIILFIQRRPKGLFPQRGRAAED
jgi:urea transport system permease protein